MRDHWTADLLFATSDYVAGALVGALTALAVHYLVALNTDMALAMLIGMAVGIVVHLVLGFLMSPLLGAFHAMIPGSLIGMYGGMIFGMRDSMQEASSRQAVLVGAVFGLVIVGAVQLYDRALRATPSGA